jgi:hypothetical protein
MRTAIPFLFASCCLIGFPLTVSAVPYVSIMLRDIPHIQQEDDFCGEACAEMILKKLGTQWTQNDVFNVSGVDPSDGRGCYSADLERALPRIGFYTGQVFYIIEASHSADEVEEQWRLLHADLLKGLPSIVCMHFDDSPHTTEHMRLITGYNARTDEVYFLDPAITGNSYQHMDRSLFLSLWPLKYDSAKWTLVRFRLVAGDLKLVPRWRGFTNADYAQHVLALKKKLPDGFDLRIEPPFVVVGNCGTEDLKANCERTVRWAVAQLKKEFFERDPKEILTIWLFKDDESYRTTAKRIFGSEPTTPYGYYSAADKALVMNISTGGGTLVHEIVHPFVRSNFPNCPAWFNEGLGSLFEQSDERNGHIVGKTNWRLRGLQLAIRDKKVRTFRDLTATSDGEFYTRDEGTNYAQARYLCYYLQEHGELSKFYQNFVSNHNVDPTGYKTLVKILGETDMLAFQAKWEKFVMGLRYP